MVHFKSTTLMEHFILPDPVSAVTRFTSGSQTQSIFSSWD